MNPMEHAHGQADFQRIFANSKRSGLWLFTEDLHSSNGRTNFNVFCEQVLPLSCERYSEIVLAKRVTPYDCELVSKVDASNAIIATWQAGHSPAVQWHNQPFSAPAPAAPAQSDMLNDSQELMELKMELMELGPLTAVPILPYVNTLPLPDCVE